MPGIITAGSASGITDGAAALVLASEAHARSLGVTPLARITGWATAGVDPRIMGIGPVPAVQQLCERTALQVEDFDLVELNEAFAPQVLAVLQDLPLDPARLNVNGGAIALGHPIGCTGARILVTLIYELRRRRQHRGPGDALRERRNGDGDGDRGVRCGLRVFGLWSLVAGRS